LKFYRLDNQSEKDLATYRFQDRKLYVTIFIIPSTYVHEEGIK